MSAALYGVADFAGGVAARSIDTWRVTAWSQLLGVPLLVIGLVVIEADDVARADLVAGAAAGLVGLIGIVSLYGALSRGTMSIVSPLTGVLTAAIPVLWGVAFGEQISTIQWIGIGTAVAAVVLIAQDHAASKLTLDVAALAILASLSFAAFFIVLDQTSEAAGLWPLAAGRAISIPLAFVIAGVTATARFPSRADLTPVVVAGNADIAANMSILLALQRGPLGVSTVLTSLYPAFTATIAVFALRERPTALQWIGIALAVVAAVLLVV